MKEKGLKKMAELTYLQAGDYLLPELTMSEQEMKPLGKYALLRRDYLRENRPVMWTALSVSGSLHSHLLEIEETANRRLTQMMKELAAAAEVTETLKAENPLRWTGLMNSLHNQAEEIILREVVFN